MEFLPHMKATHRPAPPQPEAQSEGARGARLGVETVSVKSGDLLIFRVPEKYVADSKMRGAIASSLSAGLRDISVTALLIPDWMELALLITSKEGEGKT